MVCSAKRAGGRPKQLCIPAGDSSCKMKEGDASANISRVFIYTLGRVRCKRDAVVEALRCGVVHEFLVLTDVSVERFQALAPIPVEYCTTIPSRTKVVSPTGAKNIYKARERCGWQE